MEHVMADAPKPKQLPENEEEILAFWERERIFTQAVERDAPAGDFVFFEGPPTANAPPGIHHVIGRTFKDVIPRYQTMRGKRVRRKAGWDTHGLPVELQLEKKLGLKTKKDIERYGVAKFNAACRDSVWEFKKEWERLTSRVGFWLDQRNPYVTYAMSYVESVWWFLAQAWERGLLVRDYKIVPWCPRCETVLSSHEVAQGYEDDTEDPSVFVKFELAKDSKFQIPPTLRSGQADSKFFFLVWTTTPWTLPGNGALAVHPDVEYAIVASGDERLILARPLVERVLGEGAAVERTIPGRDLVGVRYEPLYARIDTTAYPEAYQVLDADFVSMEDGTGIVHIASAYGEDDFRFTARGIPPTFSVNEKGIMADGLPGAGKFCKQADADIRADLASRGLLFRDETIRHTYPFCWRCHTPLLYYARSAWFIAMSKLRAEIQAKNQTIRWHPEHLRDGRFGEWLREAKDWALTRERYWGTPLPIWECDRCVAREVIGSFADLAAKAPKRNRFLLMRHGEAESNAREVISARVETSDRYPLTAEGRARVAKAAEQLKGAGITTIIASPYARMRETAEIVSKAIGIPVTYDERLREYDLPDFDGRPATEFNERFASPSEKFTEKIGQNETWDELARRMLLALRDIDARHDGETILICSHGDPLFLLRWAYSGRTREGIDGMPYPAFDAPSPFAFTGALVNDRGELDVHRPFVDEITWSCAKEGCGGTMERFPEVVDVWLDSGCMPFAQVHWPFEDRRGGVPSPPGRPWQAAPTSVVPPLLYPADYISEAIDQTRGWFYTLLAVATVLGWDAPYRNVICYSHILDREGKKMSKSKGNVVDPWAMIERYGADVVRWYMLTVNQPWDVKLFDEADLKAMANKPFGTLRNVLSFWELHGGGAAPQWVSLRAPTGSRGEAISAEDNAGDTLDRWLRARTAAAHAEVTRRLDAYDITDAARVVGDCIDDLSTWWLRRSRDRLKAGDASARGTFTAALRSLAMLIAPFAPFTAERLWTSLRAPTGSRGEAIPVSVHLAMWEDGAPPTSDTDVQTLTQMADARRYCSLALEARTKSGIPVRQALGVLEINRVLPDAYLALIAEEVNVKNVVVRADLSEDVRLDTTLTPALKREGMVRELTRAVNNIRKEMMLTPTDRIRVTYATDDATLAAAITEHREQLERATVASAWIAGTPTEPTELSIGGATITLRVAR